MKTVRHLFVAIAVAACAVAAHPSCAMAGPGLTVLTYGHPPYSYEKDGQTQGLAVDVVRGVMDRLGVAVHIDSKPRHEAVQTAQFLPNHVIFPVPRFRDNEILFQWVGPLVECETALFALRSASLRVRNLESAANYRIGALLHSPEEAFLREYRMPLTNIETDAASNLRKLQDGSINLWLVDRRNALATVRWAGLDAATLEEVLPVGRDTLFIAFSLATPHTTVKQWRQTLDAMKADGGYDAILAKYPAP